MTFSAVAFDYLIYLKMLFNFRNETVYYGDASPHQPQTCRPTGLVCQNEEERK